MNPASHLFLHHFEPASQVNGPGTRSVIWVQGCALACPGCFNPQTHPKRPAPDLAAASPDFGFLPGPGGSIPVSRLAERIFRQGPGIEGLTLSGGEPLQQLQAVSALLELIKSNSSLSVVLFSGYTWTEIEQMPGAPTLLKNVDILLAGRYQASLRAARGLLGSLNKTIHFLSGRYTRADLLDIPESEVILAPDGSIVISGIDPLRL